MAVRESLEFDLRGALHQLDLLERQITDLRRPVSLNVDMTGDAAREIHTIDTRLEEIVQQTQQVNRELNQMEGAADRSEADFSRLARAMGISEEAARDIAREVQQAEGAASRLDAEARSVARAMGLSEEEASRFTAELHRADRAAAGIDTRSTNLAGTFGNLKTLAIGIGGALAAIGVSGLLRGANAAIQSFAELEDSANAVNVIFGQAAQSVTKFGEDAARSAGLSETAFNQAVVPIGALLQNFGFNAREAADASVILVQRGADLASVYGGTVKDALLAVGAALRGEADPLERYGASISAARVEQFALANELARTKAEITPAITLQARYGLILADTAKVQGDYVNTAGDLANAQRTAGAEAQNFAADLGEALAPAMEVIVGLVPVLLDGLRQLVPGFAAAADSAAAFLESVAAGEGEGTGVLREFFATLRAGAGDLAELPGTIKNVFSIISGGLTQNVEAVDAAVAQMDLRFARSKLRTLGTELAGSLDKGVPAVKAFTTAVTNMAQQTDNLTAFEQAYRDFAIQADLSVPELRDSTQEMLNNAAAIGLSVPEIQFLTYQYALLNDELREQPFRQRAFSDAIADVPFESITTRFTTFTSAMDAAGASAETDLKSLADVAAAQAQRTSEAFDLFADQPAKIAESFKQGVEDLRLAVLAQLDFDVNIAILRALNLDALADDFQRIGVAAGDQLEEAINDIPSAIEADRLLQGFAGLGEEAFNALVDKLISVGLTPADARKLADSVTGIVSPEVIAAGEKAGGRIGAAQAKGTISEFHDALIEEGQQMETALIKAAIDARVAESFTADDQAEFAATATVTAWEAQAIIAADQINAAVLQAKLGDLFSDVNFVITADQFQFPSSFDAAINLLLHPTATVTGGGGTLAGGVVVQNTFVVAEGTDVTTQAAQANQSTAAVANLFNRVQS